jgi:hypothetical protein
MYDVYIFYNLKKIIKILLSMYDIYILYNLKKIIKIVLSFLIKEFDIYILYNLKKIIKIVLSFLSKDFDKNKEIGKNEFILFGIAIFATFMSLSMVYHILMAVYYILMFLIKPIITILAQLISKCFSYYCDFLIKQYLIHF